MKKKIVLAVVVAAVVLAAAFALHRPQAGTRPTPEPTLIFRAAVSLRLHKPMTTCRDTVADWRLFCRVSFAFSKLT